MSNPWLDIASYQIEDEYRFKGREDDKKKFLRIISKGTFIVLYANSGIGKTSFLNAAIIPYLKRKKYMPIRIVFPGKELDSGNIVKWLYDAIKSFGFSDNTDNERFQWRSTLETPVEELNDSLWWLLHTYEIVDNKTGEILRPLIIFDQFEEIFSKVQGDTNGIKDQLFSLISELSSDALPPQIEEVLDNLDDDIDVEGNHNFKVIFSLRKEYLSDFDYWTNDRYTVTELHQNRMFLLPMTRAQAEKVITEQPISSDNPEEYYTILNADKEEILDSVMSEDSDEYEPMILSLLCSKLYEKISNGEQGASTPKDVLKSGIDTILYEFYEDKVTKIITNKKHRRIFEAALLDKKGHRNRVKSSMIIDKFDTLYESKLEDALLIHVEKLYNDHYIELTHDRLARAIYCTKKLKKERVAKKKRYIMIGVGIVTFLFLGWLLAAYLTPEKKEIIVVTQTSAGTMVTMHIEEDSLSVTEDDPWTIDLRVKWTQDSVMRDTTITRTKQSLKDGLPPLFVDNETPVTVSVSFADSWYVEYDNTPNIDSIYDKARLEKLSYHIPIRIQREITPIKGRAVFVSGKDTVPIRDERVLLYNNITKTDANGCFSLLVPKNSQEKVSPLIMREGLAMNTIKTDSEGVDYLYVFELNCDTTAFRAQCDTIIKYYENAMHPPKDSGLKPHRYRYILYKDGKKYIDLYYTNPDKNGHTKAYFAIKDKNYEDKYLSFFVAEGQMDTHYNKQGLRNYTFYGRDCVGNKATLRSSIYNGYMHIYLYYSDKEKIFIQKIKGQEESK